jgi:hypothetical protein
MYYIFLEDNILMQKPLVNMHCAQCGLQIPLATTRDYERNGLFFCDLDHQIKFDQRTQRVQAAASSSQTTAPQQLHPHVT